MNLKEQVERLRELYDAQATHAKNYLELSEQIKIMHGKVQEAMEQEGLDSFNCASGELEIENKCAFSVAKENMEKMISYFEADANLAPMVKTVKSVHYQTRTKVFRDMYKDENSVPEFVVVNPYKELKPKFIDFKQQEQYLKKIKSKQKDKKEEIENEYTGF